MALQPNTSMQRGMAPPWPYTSATGIQPTVMDEAMTRGRKQLCPGETKLGEPSAWMKRPVNSVYGRPVPWHSAMYSGPDSFRTRSKVEAMRVSAASQPISFHWPAPRGPVRNRGRRTRSGWATNCGPAAPLGQM
jgi:hypothetical protein